MKKNLIVSFFSFFLFLSTITLLIESNIYSESNTKIENNTNKKNKNTVEANVEYVDENLTIQESDIEINYDFVYDNDNGDIRNYKVEFDVLINNLSDDQQYLSSSSTDLFAILPIQNSNNLDSYHYDSQSKSLGKNDTSLQYKLDTYYYLDLSQTFYFSLQNKNKEVLSFNITFSPPIANSSSNYNFLDLQNNDYITSKNIGYYPDFLDYSNFLEGNYGDDYNYSEFNNDKLIEFLNNYLNKPESKEQLENGLYPIFMLYDLENFFSELYYYKIEYYQSEITNIYNNFFLEINNLKLVNANSEITSKKIDKLTYFEYFDDSYIDIYNLNDKDGNQLYQIELINEVESHIVYTFWFDKEEIKNSSYLMYYSAETKDSSSSYFNLDEYGVTSWSNPNYNDNSLIIFIAVILSFLIIIFAFVGLFKFLKIKKVIV